MELLVLDYPKWREYTNRQIGVDNLQLLLWEKRQWEGSMQFVLYGYVEHNN